LKTQLFPLSYTVKTQRTTEFFNQYIYSISKIHIFFLCGSLYLLCCSLCNLIQASFSGQSLDDTAQWKPYILALLYMVLSLLLKKKEKPSEASSCTLLHSQPMNLAHSANHRWSPASLQHAFWGQSPRDRSSRSNPHLVFTLPHSVLVGICQPLPSSSAHGSLATCQSKSSVIVVIQVVLVFWWNHHVWNPVCG